LLCDTESNALLKSMYATVTEWPSCIVNDQSFKLSSKFVQVVRQTVHTQRALSNRVWATYL